MSDIVLGGWSDTWRTDLGYASVRSPDIRPPPQTISYTYMLIHFLFKQAWEKSFSWPMGLFENLKSMLGLIPKDVSSCRGILENKRRTDKGRRTRMIEKEIKSLGIELRRAWGWRSERDPSRCEIGYTHTRMLSNERGCARLCMGIEWKDTDSCVNWACVFPILGMLIPVVLLMKVLQCYYDHHLSVLECSNEGHGYPESFIQPENYRRRARTVSSCQNHDYVYASIVKS